MVRKHKDSKAITQATKPQGQEGGLAPALLEWHSISGGKPAFPTLRFT